LITRTYSLCMLLQIMIESPLVSKPVRPALPLIYLYFAASMREMAIKGYLKKTTLAGRLIPVLKVEVATNTNKAPVL
jgi:hypothetical protein